MSLVSGRCPKPSEQVFGARSGGFRKIGVMFSSEKSRLPEGVLWFSQSPPPLKMYIKHAGKRSGGGRETSLFRC